MYYIIDEGGEVFKTIDKAEALMASEDGVSIVIDATHNVVLLDGEATKIAVWEPPESDDEEGDEDEDSDD